MPDDPPYFSPSLWQAVKRAVGQDTLLFGEEKGRPTYEQKPPVNPTDRRAITSPAKPDMSAVKPGIGPAFRLASR